MFAESLESLHYKQAQASLKHVINSLDLTPREREGLQPEIDNLLGFQKKLEQGRLHLAVFGMVGRGKSSLLNALVGQPVFITGPLHGVTQDILSVDWQVDIAEDAHVRRISLTDRQSQQHSAVELIDTPGIDEVGGEQRQQLAERVAQQSDLILFVVAADLTQVEYDALGWLRQLGKPILLVFNKADQYAADEQTLLLAKLCQRVRPLNILSEDIVTAAAAPLQTTVVYTDGQRRQQRMRGIPDIQNLKLKILEVLEREGKALIALNTLLYTDDIQAKLVARKLEIRRRRADDLIWQTTLAKAVAVALNPLLLADVVGGVAIDLGLVVSLSKLYGLPMTQQESLKLLQTIAIATGSLSISELLITLGLSSLKGILGAAGLATGGLTLAPYFSVALTQAAVAGVATYAIGQVTCTYLVNGASWGDQGPKAIIAKIIDDLDEASIMARLKHELSQKLHRSD